MEQLDDILQQATAGIGREYFLLPIHGADPVQRERVYCYELYHQMRLRWPAPDFCPYRLNGEIDKGGHPYFRNARGTPKPDLLVHVPGAGDNYAVIEVKSSFAKAKGIRKDLGTLCRFANFGYQRAIYLVYGAEAVLARIQRSAGDPAIPIEVWFHPAVGAPAIFLPEHPSRMYASGRATDTRTAKANRNNTPIGTAYRSTATFPALRQALRRGTTSSLRGRSSNASSPRRGTACSESSMKSLFETVT